MESKIRGSRFVRLMKTTVADNAEADPRVVYSQRASALLSPKSDRALLVLVLATFLEVAYAFFPILLILMHGDTPYMILGAVSWISALLSLVCAYMVNKQRWWSQVRRVDAIMIYGIASCIAYGFAAADKAKKDELPGLTNWMIHAIAVYPILTFTLAGQVRSMTKWYPWSRGTIYFYKLVRSFHVIWFVLINLTSSAHGIISGPTLGFFSTTLSMIAYLLGIVLAREKAVKEQTRSFFNKGEGSDYERLKEDVDPYMQEGTDGGEMGDLGEVAVDNGGDS